MYELVQVGERTFYFDCPNKMGLYKLSDSEVILIDSGRGTDPAKKVLKTLEAKGWNLKAIYCTHSHLDHVGGNNYLQERTGCDVFLAGADYAFVSVPVLEASYICGGFPVSDVRRTFMHVEPCDILHLKKECLPEGLEMIRLDGHTFAMSAFKTSDGVWFLADSLLGKSLLEKHRVPFIFDVQKYLDSLETIKTLEGNVFIPSHGEVVSNILPMAEENILWVEKVVGVLCDICDEQKTMEVILKELFERMEMRFNVVQHALIGCTTRSYLSYMKDRGLVENFCFENQVFWKRVKG